MGKSKTIHVSGFRSLVPAEDVKAVFEKYTRKGTVYAVEVKESKKKGNGVYARIQFLAVRSAKRIITLANQQRIRYKDRYLKVYRNDVDIIQKPRLRTSADEIEDITLHFGCQVSKEKYSVFWRKTKVGVEFGSGLHKFYFNLSHESVDYRLQLSSENIWQVELRRPRGQTKKFILIQLSGAPRIFEKPTESIYSFYREVPDDQWIRATDFSPSFALGQSSALCLEIPHGVNTPDFGESAIYKENDGQFILVSGFTFSSSDLVPVVTPPQGIQLPYNIYFKVCTLVQNGYVPGPAIDDRFYQLLDPRTGISTKFTEHALEKLNNLKECCYDPVRWFSEQYIKYSTSRQRTIAPANTLDTGLAYVHRVQITPCRVFFCVPEVNMSNRVLRNFSKHIVRNQNE